MATVPIQIFDGMITNVSAILGTAVPALSKYIVKEIHLYNSGAGVNRVRIRLVGVDSDLRIIVDENMAAAATLHLPFSLVMVAAQQLNGFATVTNEVHATISGVQTP